MEERQESLDNTSQQVAEAHREVEAARNDADTLAQRLESIERQRSQAQQQTRKVHVLRGRLQQHINKIKDTLKSYETALEDINNKLSVSDHTDYEFDKNRSFRSVDYIRFFY